MDLKYQFLLFLLSILSTVIILGTVWMLLNLEIFKNVAKYKSFNSKKCRHLGDTATITPSVEDFRFVSKDIIILGSTCIKEFLDHGDLASPKGRLYACDLITERLKLLEFSDFPTDVAFRCHGLDYSKRTGVLYVVNHANHGEERIEMFQVTHPTVFDSIRLKWTGFVSPTLIPKGSGNAVTECSENEIYVTHWLPYDIPAHGLENPKTWKEKLNVILNYAVVIGGRALGLPMFSIGSTGVVKINLKTKETTYAAKKFVSANGIASSPDGRLVFVVDCLRQTLSVFNRDLETGDLLIRKVFSMPHLGDNVTCHSTTREGEYELWIGTMPDFLSYLLSSVKNDGRLVAGGFLLGTFDSIRDKITWNDVFIHDGSKLAVCSTGAKYNDKYLLSGPRSKGGILITE